jgi:hypothetical protein
MRHLQTRIQGEGIFIKNHMSPTSVALIVDRDVREREDRPPKKKRLICQPYTITSPSALKACVPHTGLDHTWPKTVESGSRGAGRMRAEESQTRCARPTESIELLQKRQKKANRVSRSCPCATSRPCAKKRVGGLGSDGPKMGGQTNTWFNFHFNDAALQSDRR